MSEDDIDLNEMVLHTLENKGCLAKIKANIRANVFFALHENEVISSKSPLLNYRLEETLKSNQGKLMFSLVYEFLEYFKLDFALSVYAHESFAGSKYVYNGRADLESELELKAVDSEDEPILMRLLGSLISPQLKKTVHVDLLKIQNASPEASTVEDDSSESNVSGVAENDCVLNHKVEIRISDPQTLEDSLPDGFVNKTLLDVANNGHNATFELNSPVFKSIKNNDVGTGSNTESSTPRSNGSDEQRDDTYEGTSSIAEDSLRGDGDKETDKIASDQLNRSNESSPTSEQHRISKLSKFDATIDKIKNTPSPNKLRSKNSIATLSDLPPLNLNKMRANDAMLLPSLYAKDFKEKHAQKDLEQLIGDNNMDQYEEDFMSSGNTEPNDTLNNLSELGNSENVSAE